MSRQTMLRWPVAGLFTIGLSSVGRPRLRPRRTVEHRAGVRGEPRPGLDRVVVRYDLASGRAGGGGGLGAIREAGPGRAARLRLRRPQGRVAAASQARAGEATASPGSCSAPTAMSWAGELPFTVAPASPVFGPTLRVPAAPSPGGGDARAPRVRAFAAAVPGPGRRQPVAGSRRWSCWWAEPPSWPGSGRPGAALPRTRLLLGGSLVAAVLATAAALGLKGAAIRGGSVLGAFSPTALTALNGTHVGQLLLARLCFLALAAPVVAYLGTAPRRALRSSRWWIGAAISGIGTLATHGLLSHASARGPLAVAANVVHFGAISVWLGGLTMLAAVCCPDATGPSWRSSSPASPASPSAPCRRPSWPVRRCCSSSHPAGRRCPPPATAVSCSSSWAW